MNIFNYYKQILLGSILLLGNIYIEAMQMMQQVQEYAPNTAQIMTTTVVMFQSLNNSKETPAVTTFKTIGAFAACTMAKKLERNFPDCSGATLATGAALMAGQGKANKNDGASYCVIQ